MGQAMIVTCDHCGTRYKLDDSKIPERGARITCPSCRHVFAVYRTPPGAAATLPPSAVAMAESPSPASATLPPTARPSIAEEAAKLDINGINFRDVGIGSWKVKVKIGLVYDFNDFKTLNKYIRDGRVSGSDLLSHDGSSWVPMEAIGDLEQHFRETYVRARRAMESADDSEIPEDEPTRVMAAPIPPVTTSKATKKGPASKTTSVGSVDGDLAAAFAAAAAAEDGGEASSAKAEPTRTGKAGAERRFVDPFEAQQQRKRSGEGKPPPTSSSSSGASSTTSRSGSSGSSGATLGLGVVVVLALLGGGYYIMNNNSGATQSPDQPTQVTTVTPAPEAQDAAAARIQRELEEAARARVGEPPPNPDYEEEPELVPVVPEEFRGPSGGSKSSGLENGTYSVQDQSASDHYQMGTVAAASNDWRRAAQSFQKAVELAPSNSSYLERLGEAQYQLGEAEKARSTLNKANNRGSTLSLKYLGHIAYDQGDESGAMTFYRRYLSSNPPDRQDIERRIATLSGG